LNETLHVAHVPEPDEAGQAQRIRAVLFLGIFAIVAGGGLLYDFSRPAVYRATARLSVDPPGVDDAAAKAQFAISEALALRRSEFVDPVMKHLGAQNASEEANASSFERQLTTEVVPQTNVIELRAEGADRNRLVEALGAWIEVYQGSRKESDRQEVDETLVEAKHELQVADRAIDGKRREMEAFRQRYGISSIEREENLGTSRLKGLQAALNDAETKEVTAEARLKAVDESIAQGKGYVRAADKAAIGNLEMRAVELREKIKDLEHDFTPQYLALDPKFKALRANLARIEKQIESEKDRSQKAALAEAQEELAGAKRASLKIREQADALKQENQSFSMRFVELRRMAADLEQLQDARRTAADRLRKLESARKPAAVRVQVLTAPTAEQDPVSPNYFRDAAYSLGAGIALAIGAVWLWDYLRKKTPVPLAPAAQPIIQIAYPALHANTVAHPPTTALPTGSNGLLGPSSMPAVAELGTEDVAALWNVADPKGRLVLAAFFAGVAPNELSELRWANFDLATGIAYVPGPSARPIPIVEPLRTELLGMGPIPDANAPLLADGLGAALTAAEIDGHLAYLAHDAGLRHPEEVTGRALHFTYAAFLARQGMRMTDLAATVGRLLGGTAAELMRLSPPGRSIASEAVERVYPCFRAG
jgi:uncharacterized protein involved in exopolysaccharide biosynthesis